MRRTLVAVLALLACAADEPYAPGEPEAPVIVDYFLPLACGATAVIGQGNHGEFSHTGLAAYAFDILLDQDTAVHAMADGVVLHAHNDTRPGDPCHDGGDESCQPFANLVVLGHADGTATLYKHLNDVHVAVGDEVLRGQVLGLSGQTGWATRPHLHLARTIDCGGDLCQTIALEFVEVGVPQTFDSVTSMNCRG